MDEFDKIAFAEEDEAHRGYVKGIAHGVEVGNIEGFSIGISRGQSLSDEVAFYFGFCEFFKMKFKSISSKRNVNDEKIETKLFQTVSILEKVMQLDVEHEHFSELVKELRKKFKILTSVLNIKVSYLKQSNVMSY